MNHPMLEGQKAHSPTHVAPLPSCVPPEAGPVRLMYDATLDRPLRLRDRGGTKLAPDIHCGTLDRLAQIDAALRPLALHYLSAELRGGGVQGCGLDAGRLGQLPRVLYAYAAVDALQGIDLNLRPSARVVPGQGAERAVDAGMHVRAGETALTDPGVRAAVEAYAAWAAKAWAHAVGSTLGPWLLSSGVSELRLAGTIRPDQTRQLDVLAGQPIDGRLLH